jgi:guanylate kinase
MNKVLPGELFVISAPSGTGKTTLVRSLFTPGSAIAARLRFSVSHTTRAIRPGEVEGRDYIFVDVPTFKDLIDRDHFLEWADVFGKFYGTSRALVESRLLAGHDVLLDIDVQGALQVKARKPEACLIFILPPSYSELERRLRGRASDDPAAVERRLETAAREVQEINAYDYVILNDHLPSAAQALAAVLLARRHRIDRQKSEIERVLASFAACRPAQS